MQLKYRNIATNKYYQDKIHNNLNIKVNSISKYTLSLQYIHFCCSLNVQCIVKKRKSKHISISCKDITTLGTVGL